jgi:hypothetical protein
MGPGGPTGQISPRDNIIGGIGFIGAIVAIGPISPIGPIINNNMKKYQY